MNRITVLSISSLLLWTALREIRFSERISHSHNFTALALNGLTNQNQFEGNKKRGGGQNSRVTYTFSNISRITNSKGKNLNFDLILHRNERHKEGCREKVVVGHRRRYSSNKVYYHLSRDVVN